MGLEEVAVTHPDAVLMLQPLTPDVVFRALKSRCCSAKYAQVIDIVEHGMSHKGDSGKSMASQMRNVLCGTTGSAWCYDGLAGSAPVKGGRDAAGEKLGAAQLMFFQKIF